MQFTVKSVMYQTIAVQNTVKHCEKNSNLLLKITSSAYIVQLRRDFLRFIKIWCLVDRL